MRNRLPWIMLALATGLFGPTSTSVRAQMTLVETTEIMPRSVVELPRTYYVPSTFTSSPALYPTTATVYGLAPTSYYVPTRYVPTTYYSATSAYLPTSYVYRPRRARRFVETAYLLDPTVYLSPTYYVAPTSYVASVASGLVTSSTICCESAAPASTARSTRAAVEPMPERQAGGTIESSAVGDPDEQLAPASATRTQPVVPPTPATVRPTGPANTNTGAGTPQSGSNAGGTGAMTKDAKAGATAPAVVPGAPVAPTPKAATAPVEGTTPPARTELDAPVIPAPVPPPTGTAEDPLGFPKDELNRRSSYKPVIVPPVAPPRRNVLRGRVVSADTRLPESDVELILSDRLGRFVDRSTHTDGSGRFAIALPEGDWTILVTMRSGRPLALDEGLVTATAGKVNDRWGRELTNLVISR